jgi:hypothetical protein
MKKINLKHQLKDIKGNPIGTISRVVVEDKKSVGGLKLNTDGSVLQLIVQDPAQIITSGSVIAEALVFDNPEEKSDMMSKAKKFSLSMKIVDAEEIELDEAQITMVLERVNALCSVMPQGIQIAGQIYNLLNE